MRGVLRGGERATPGPLLRFLQLRWDLGLFIAGLLALAVGYGIAVGKDHAFPHAWVNRALEAERDWRANWRAYLGLRSQFLLPTTRTVGGVTRYDRDAAWPGLTFLTMYRDGRFGASLVDMDGRTLHKWDIVFSQVWPEQHHLDVTPPDSSLNYQGAALLPDGDVVLNLDGSGTVRLDRCSRVVWKLPAETHHSVDLLPRGDALIPAHHERAAADRRFPQVRPGPSGYFLEDTILRVRPDGSVAAEVSVLDVLYRSGWQALLLANGGTSLRRNDPTHLNDAEVLRPELAAAFPMFRAGDVMLSLRNLNTILVVDGASWRVKWAMTGPFLNQHDPDFLPNGHILLFDNRRGLGHSRILEIDPATREVVWSYQGTDAEPFYSEIRGAQQLLPNQDVLVADPDEGRAFEVARTGRIVWEYVNLVRDGFVGMVTEAERVAPERLTFLGKGCG